MELGAATRETEETFLRTISFKDFFKTGHFAADTDAWNKAWEQEPSCKETMGEGSIFISLLAFLC